MLIINMNSICSQLAAPNQLKHSIKTRPVYRMTIITLSNGTSLKKSQYCRFYNLDSLFNDIEEQFDFIFFRENVST